jgi:hypothetical protein
MLKVGVDIILPDGRPAEVERVTSSSARVRPYSVKKDNSLKGKGKRRKYYDDSFHISIESEVEEF